MKNLGTTTLCPQAQKRAKSIIVPVLNEMDSLRNQGKEHILARFVGEGEVVLVIAYIHGGFIVERRVKTPCYDNRKHLDTAEEAFEEIVSWL